MLKWFDSLFFKFISLVRFLLLNETRFFYLISTASYIECTLMCYFISVKQNLKNPVIACVSNICINVNNFKCSLVFQGCWRKIIVDDTLPYDDNERLLLPCTTMQHEVWPMLLTKALIKVASLE